MPAALSTLKAEFGSAFHQQPDGVVSAPGRVNIIGEHTDYNGGFALPCALNMTTAAVFRIRKDPLVHVRSKQYPGEEDHFDVSGEIVPAPSRWMSYARGAFRVMQEYGFPIRQGMDLWITGDLPPDIGLGSSAALSEAVIGAISKGMDLPMDKRSLALIGQKTEHDFLGNQCGIMDQLTAVFGKAGHLLLIDCEDFNIDYIPFPEQLSIVIMDSCCKRQLAQSAYNDRRRECGRAANAMNARSWREATLEDLHGCQSGIDEAAFRRARHVITENDRTVRAAEALRHLNLDLVYKLMNDSHESLKSDFEITVPETDALAQFCRETRPRKVGARMTGGGFGGCIVALCEQHLAKQLAKSVSDKFEARFNRRVPAYICQPGGGMKVARFD